MTRDNLQDVPVTSADEFKTVLAEAVEKAIMSDVDVRGAWEFRTRGSTDDWELVISELSRDGDSKEQQ